MAAAAIDRYLVWACARAQQQTRQLTPLLWIDGTDRRKDGRTLNRFMMLTAHYVDLC